MLKIAAAIFAIIIFANDARAVECNKTQIKVGDKCQFCPERNKVILIPNFDQTECIDSKEWMNPNVECEPNEFQTKDGKCQPCNKMQVSRGNRCEFCEPVQDEDGRQMIMIPNESQSDCIPAKRTINAVDWE
ncbi:MAG: hypothetical protein LBB23_00315 [Rickettsiales bacterium]|jgi:hypothetical protein|nr:hypothetical protein [Rickettsiales bacterium]